MTREELITLGQHKVRSNEHLMLFYLTEFEKLFGRKPNCAGCTFKTDWKRFSSNNENIQKPFKMENDKKTFEITIGGKSKIHTYKVGKQPRRSYGHNMSESFAKAYLTNGTKEEIESRKKWFRVLPKEDKEMPSHPTTIMVEGEEVFLSDATGKQMTAYAKENDIDFGDATRVDDKRKVIADTL